MKLKRSLATIALACLLPFVSRGQEPGQANLNIPIDQLPKVVQTLEFDCLFVQLPEKVALSIVPKLRDPKQAGKAFGEIMDLIGKNQALLIGWPVLKTKSGQRAVVEQIEEIRFAAEFDPGGTTQRVEQTAPVSGVNGGPPAPVNASGTPQAPDKIRAAYSYSNAMPKSFQTRNIGVTLEIEGVIGPDLKTVDLSLVPQHISLLEMRRIVVEEEASKKKVVVEQPTFVTNKVTTSISVQDGDYSLLGTFKVPKPEGSMELFILHTQIKKMPLGEMQKPPEGGR